MPTLLSSSFPPEPGTLIISPVELIHLDSDLTPSQSLKLAQSASSSQSQISDLFTLSLRRLTTFKSGAPFSEHSPLLFQLCQMPSWNKPQSGLRKMFLGEVVGKRVVVQGLWIGGWGWGEEMPDDFDGKERRKEKEKKVNGMLNGQAGGIGLGEGMVTGVPWKRDDKRQQVLEATRSTWTNPSRS